MTRGHRWPLHPKPQSEESLSSWVFRLAQEYEMTWEEFFGDALRTDPLSDRLLDRQPPVSLVQTLAVRTGVQPERIWMMTLSGYVPWIIDTIDTDDADCLSTYATQYQTLLKRQTPWMSKGLYNPKTGRYCLPWLSEPGASDQTLCLACLRADQVPHLRLFWRLGLMGSCPLHGCLLTTLPWPALSIIPYTDVSLESADRDLLSVDELSLQAVTHGQVRFQCGAEMGAAVYVRFLRSLIEELFCRRGAAGNCADTIVAIWEEVGCRPYAGLLMSKPFERLTLQQRRDTLRAVGRLLGDLPASLQRRMPPAAWGLLPSQRLPYALDHLYRRSQVDCRDDLSIRATLPRPKTSQACGIQTERSPLREAMIALEQLVQSDEGAEQLIRFITTYSNRQTPEQLWQLVREMRAASPASSPRQE